MTIRRPTPQNSIIQLVPSDEADAPPQTTKMANEFVNVLVHMIDVQRPGAAARGRQLTDAVRQLAARFQVPPAFMQDLEWAAQLHEIGLAVDGSVSGTGWLSPADVRSLIVAQHLLNQVEVLRPAAFLVASIAENWDGSGFPDRLQRGQIPMRSRLLRVLIDFNVVSEPEPGVRISTDAALSALGLHAGTWYDPAVVAQLTVIVTHIAASAEDLGKYRVSVARLRPGMVLAEDLRTASGLKLVAGGATVTAHMLEVIRQRDTVDPVIDAWVAPGMV
jgi:response regulator RpfG family c-di-GMP phosphodiesterase